MDERRLVVLLVEDNPDHARLIKRLLADAARAGLSLESVDRLSAALKRLRQGGIDVVLSDLGLPDSPAAHTLPRLLESAPDVPIVILTAHGDLEQAAAAVQQGAQDYLVKTQMTGELLVRSIRYAIERKRARLELEHYAAELERSNHESQRFAQVVSHDLKSPLAVVSYACDLLRRQIVAANDPDSAKAVERITQAVRRMRELIDDLLNYARVGSRPHSPQPVDCQEVLQTALANLEAEIAAAAAAVTHDPLPVVQADRSRLTQVVQNLIGNALKYRRDVPPVIHIGVRRQPEQWVFSVEDNGIGFDPQHADRIFQVFERLHGDDRYSGTGMGLAICKRIIEQHGGRIWAESQPGVGSRFVFTLPAADNE